MGAATCVRLSAKCERARASAVESGPSKRGAEVLARKELRCVVVEEDCDSTTQWMSSPVE
jgi:hypothetical protein